MLVQQGSQFSPRRSTAKAPWTASEARQTLGHAAQSGMSLAQYSRSLSSPCRTLTPDSFTEATTAPLRRQMEQSQRLGFSIPFGKSNSSTTP